MQVRRAELYDYGHLLSMQMAHNAELKDKELSLHFQWDTEKASESLAEYMINPAHLFLVCVDDEDEITGYMWLALIQPHYTFERYATELYTYIKPEHRNGATLKLLIDEAKLASRLASAKVLQLGNMSSNKSLEKAYNKRFKKAGSLYWIELDEI